MLAVAEERDRRRTPRCSPRRPASRPTSPAAPRSARSSRRCAAVTSRPGSRVVLVVTGARPQPSRATDGARDEIDADANDVLGGARACGRSVMVVAHGRPRDTAAPLRRDVRLLGTILGTRARRAGGRVAARAVERIRRDARVARRRDGDRRRASIRTLGAREQALVLRAFGLYFQLANIAEQHHRLRRRREDAHDGARLARVARRRVRSGSATAVDELRRARARLDPARAHRAPDRGDAAHGPARAHPHRRRSCAARRPAPLARRASARSRSGSPRR